jgi:NAD(P)-dependent dehydrogenase (short-subunit alcohol dehydrogenase family)
LATAHKFIQRGAKVVIAGRDVARGEQAAHELVAAGGNAIFVQADVSKAADVEALVARVVAVYGRLDYAFNNAGAESKQFACTADFDEAEFDRLVAVNLKGVFLCMKYEIKQMLAQEPKGGSIVNTSSVAGLDGGPTVGPYSAAKGGVINLSKTAAHEYAQNNIRVNALVAGSFQTPMKERIIDAYAAKTSAPRESFDYRFSLLSPMRRVGDAKEAAEAAIWLCSDAASFVTGHAMVVDGGCVASISRMGRER